MFCEHGLSPDPNIARMQASIEPLWKRIASGCHLTRDVARMVRDGGFAIASSESMYLPSTPKFAGYNVWGEAYVA